MLISNLLIIVGIAVLVSNYTVSFFMLSQLKNIDVSSKGFGWFVSFGSILLSSVLAAGFFYIAYKVH